VKIEPIKPKRDLTDARELVFWENFLLPGFFGGMEVTKDNEVTLTGKNFFFHKEKILKKK
jgi:hypothetical protein